MLFHCNISFENPCRIRFSLFRQPWWTPCQLPAYVCTQSVQVTHCGEWHIAMKIPLNNIKTASSNQISSLRVVWQDSSTCHCLGAKAPRWGAPFTDTGLSRRWQSHISPCWGKSILLVKSLHAMCWAQRDDRTLTKMTYSAISCGALVWIVWLNLSPSDNILDYKRWQYSKLNNRWRKSETGTL